MHSLAKRGIFEVVAVSELLLTLGERDLRLDDLFFQILQRQSTEWSRIWVVQLANRLLNRRLRLDGGAFIRFPHDLLNSCDPLVVILLEINHFGWLDDQ